MSVETERVAKRRVQWQRYYADNKARLLANGREYRREHSAKRKLLNKKRYSTSEKTTAAVTAYKTWAVCNPERYAELQRSARVRHRLRKYGITLDEFNALLVQQNGCCAICGSKNSGVKLNGRDGPKRCSKNGWPSVSKKEGHRPWHIDHDHQTGRVRGLLCHSCNLALGYVKDDVSLLRRMVSYLERMK
jgi:hypothetical protein